MLRYKYHWAVTKRFQQNWTILLQNMIRSCIVVHEMKKNAEKVPSTNNANYNAFFSLSLSSTAKIYIILPILLLLLPSLFVILFCLFLLSKQNWDTAYLICFFFSNRWIFVSKKHENSNARGIPTNQHININSAHLTKYNSIIFETKWNSLCNS